MKILRLTVDLLVDEDIWNEKKAQGYTDADLSNMIRRSLGIKPDSFYYDAEVMNAVLMERK